MSVRRMLIWGIIGLITVAFGASAETFKETTIDIPSRPAQTVRTLLLKPETAIGSVILLAGGHGNLSLSPDGNIGLGRANHLVRTRTAYAKAGYFTLVPDVATDLKVGKGVVPEYRWSREHADDIGALIAYARELSAPVYLVGTSRAALSVANAAVYTSGHARPDALVITSGMLLHIDDSQPSVERNVPNLDHITQPTLIVVHNLDACAYTPASSAYRFRSLLRGAARVDIKTLEGGERGASAPCGAKSHHGFLGIDDAVVSTITDWLEKLPRPAVEIQK